MAPFELREVSETDEISIYAEFITSLCVANIFVGSKRRRVKKVTVEQRLISVTLADAGTGKLGLTLSAALPNSVRLLPNTCSSLQPTPHGWLLRMNIDEIPEASIPDPDARGPFHPQCRACETSILRPGSTISNLVPMAALGLPPGMEWDQLGLSYFCHDHEHHDDSDPSQDEALAKQTTFAPKPDEVFVCDSAYVISAAAIDFSRLVAGSDGSIRCGRCRLELGRTTPGCKGGEGGVKLYVDAVVGDDVEKLLGTFVKDGSGGCRRMCASLQDSEDLLLLWIMDRNLKTFQARLAEKKCRSAERDVCKIMYKQENLDSKLAQQWVHDSMVKRVEIHESLLAHLTAALVKSTESLPMAWRYANDFCVGYLSV